MVLLHGDVNVLLQDNPKANNDELGNTIANLESHRFKMMEYDYDLISGNVHSVSYQRGKSDAWHHAYKYDADNRITEVFTSTHADPMAVLGATESDPVAVKELWDNDAKYFYYEHGPLARVELGDNQVQGVDYAYTLQGWLKGTNSNSLDANRDMGQDGNANNALNQYIARDAYSYSLGYYEGDYESVNAGSVSPLPQWYAEIDGSDIDNQSNDLWNGNIGIMQTTLMRSDNQGVLTAENLGMAYNYDQLNRLKDAKGYLDFNYTNNAWESTGESAKFKNSFTFDANGNINSQKRYQFERTTTNPIAGTDVLVDDLVYKYHESDPTNPAASRRISNRLYSVNDAVADLSYPDDIHDMGEYMYPTQTNPTVQVNGDNNYIYSKIGELVGDAQEEIDEIVWRVDSKIKEVKRNASSDKKSLKFEYDPMGNRIAKYVYDGEMLESSTFYVRDAQGTTIAVYDEKMITEVVNSTSITTVKYALAERHIYGSSRLGMDTTEVVVPQNEMVISPTSETTITRHLKKKLYELSNHLGNVLTVISDMKIPVGDPTTGVLEYYNPHIISVTDYSPFGVALSARTWSEQEYRFGFQAQEQDEEMWGGSVTYKYRVEDPRLGRFFAVDPLFYKYPWNSNYAFSENRVTNAIELEGLEAVDQVEMKSEANLNCEIEATTASLRENEAKLNEYLANLEKLNLWVSYRIVYEFLKYEVEGIAEAEGEVVEKIVEESLDYAESEAELNDIKTDLRYASEDEEQYVKWANYYYGKAEKDASCLNEMFSQRIYCQLFDKGVLTLIQTNALSDKILVAQNMSSSSSKMLSQGNSFLGFGDSWGNMNAEQQWIALKVFLDTGVKNCAEFAFEGGCDAYQNSSTSRAVIDYLVNQNGYVWNGDKLVKPQ